MFQYLLNIAFGKERFLRFFSISSFEKTISSLSKWFFQKMISQNHLLKKMISLISSFQKTISSIGSFQKKISQNRLFKRQFLKIVFSKDDVSISSSLVSISSLEKAIYNNLFIFIF